MARPNFLLFITDQHRVDYLGCSGHPVLKTPHIEFDRRARHVLRAVLCGDAGLHAQPRDLDDRAHALGAWRAQQRLSAVASLQHLRRCAARGRLRDRTRRQEPSAEFLPLSADPQARRRPRPGEQVLDASFAEARKPIAGDGPYDQEHPKRWEAGHDFVMQLPFYGFEHVDLCTAHGDQVGGHYYVWLKSRRPDADALRDHKNQLPHDYVCPQAFRTPIPEELYPTAYIADKSCEWLGRYAEGDRDQAVLPDGFVSRSAPSVHAARPLLVDV